MLLGAFQFNNSNRLKETALELKKTLYRKFQTGIFDFVTSLGFILTIEEGESKIGLSNFQATKHLNGCGTLIVDGYLLKPVWKEYEQYVLNAYPEFGVSTKATTFNGSYNIIEWDDITKTVHIANDRLGFRSLYYWISEDQTKLIISSNLYLLRFLLPSMRPNLTAFAQQTLISCTLDGNTLINGVHRLLPGSMISFTQASISQINGIATIPWGDKLYDLPLEDVSDTILNTASEVMKDWVGSDSAMVSLSGGYDSRFLTLVARPYVENISAINLGTSDWIDTNLANQFCSVKGIPLKICSPPKTTTFDEYISIVKIVEHVSDYLSPFWLIKYAGCISEYKKSVINGFFGGPLTGSTIKWVTDGKDEWVQILTKWYRAINACNVSLETLLEVCSVDIREIENQIIDYFNNINHFGIKENYQRLCNLEFKIRQYGFVALGTYNLFRNFCKILVPFVDHRLLYLFTNISYDHLVEQKAYLQAIKTIDNSGAPFASTSAKLLHPSTYSYGPKCLIEDSFRKLSQDFIEYINSHKVSLSPLFKVDYLAELLTEESLQTRPNISISQRLILLNAAILLIEFSM